MNARRSSRQAIARVRRLFVGLSMLAAATGLTLSLGGAPAAADGSSPSLTLAQEGSGQVVATPGGKPLAVPTSTSSPTPGTTTPGAPGAVVSVTDAPGHVYLVNPVTGAPTTRAPATSTWGPDADLVYASAQDTGATVTLTAKTVESDSQATYEPASDGHWITNDTYIGWQLVPTSASTPEYEVYFQLGTTGKPDGALFHSAHGQASQVSCGVDQTYSQTSGYVVRFSAACIPGLTTFSWNVFSHYDAHTNDPDGKLAIGKVLPDVFDDGGVRNASPVTAGSAAPGVDGYRLMAADGGVFDFGEAQFYGSMGGSHLNEPIVGGAATLDGDGYWLVASDGGIFTFGDAQFYGSTGAMHLNKPIVGMALDPAGDGYWLVASDGGIFTFGGATFDGSAGGMHLNKPVVGMAADPSGGYWLVASDGGIFTFGGATFGGSPARTGVDHPVACMAATPAVKGYWLATDLGRIFAYGNAAPLGSTVTVHLNKPVVGIAADPVGSGYWLVASDGGVFAFGQAGYFGSTGGMHLNEPIVGMAAL